MSFNWNKELVKKVLDLWETKSIAEISDEIGCSKIAVGQVAAIFRRNGGNLPKKNRSLEITKMVQEVLAEAKV